MINIKLLQFGNYLKNKVSDEIKDFEKNELKKINV